MKYLLMFTAFLFFSWNEKPVEVLMSDATKTASIPHFCQDNQGNPVLSWVEKEDNKTSFYYAIFDAKKKRFGKKILVPTVNNLSIHAEGMPKIAFKKDGTIVAVFEQKRVSEKSRFGSTLYYSMSTDLGKNWAKPSYLPFDTTGTSHSFSDITTLKNGEVAAVWLDEKNTPTSKGRTVRYATTSRGTGFKESIVVENDACECCRTNVFEDSKNRIHLAFRDQNAAGERDISHIVSVDGGKTFSESQTFSPDFWKVNACPHSGPSMTETNGKIMISWFTGKENEEKIQVFDLTTNKLLLAIKSAVIKHPQIATWNNKTVLVYEEIFNKNEKYFKKICLKTIDLDDKISTKYITEDDEDAAYPVLLPNNQNLLIAYESKTGDTKSQIKYQMLDAKIIK